MKRTRRMSEGKLEEKAPGRGMMAAILAMVLCAGLAACVAIAREPTGADDTAVDDPAVDERVEKACQSAEHNSRTLPDLEANNEPAASLAASATRNDKTLQKDLALYYSFDDDADGKVYDGSGNENHGTVVGNVVYEPSFRGRAARFTGSGTYVLSDAAGLNMQGWTRASVSVWIKTNRLTTYGNILSRGEVTGDTPSGMSLRAGGDWCKAFFSIQRQYQENPAVAERVNSSSLQPRHMDRVGKWVHLACTFDGDFLRLYVNGQLDREMEVSSRGLHLWDRSDHKLVIGNSSLKSRMAWSDKYFDGAIDEVKIWKRGLTANEVERLFTVGKGLAGR